MNNLVALSLLNNIVETMLNSIVGPMFLTYDNNVVEAIVQATTLLQLVRFWRG